MFSFCLCLVPTSHLDVTERETWVPFVIQSVRFHPPSNVSLTLTLCVSEARRRSTRPPRPVRGASVTTWWRPGRRSWRLTCRYEQKSWAVTEGENHVLLDMMSQDDSDATFNVRGLKFRKISAEVNRSVEGQISGWIQCFTQGQALHYTRLWNQFDLVVKLEIATAPKLFLIS